MEKDFRNWITQRQYFKPSDRVLVALSGGVDSVVLTHLLYQLPASERPQLFLAHVNHHLREVSNREQDFVEKWANELQLPLFVYEWMPEKQPKTNIEQAAREIRYDFFVQVMKQENIDYLLTAHHQDDQVETILMRLFQGKNVELLTGIPEVSQRFNRTIIRPLLPFSKSQLYIYAKKNQLTYFEDETNFEAVYYRNFIRTQIIPPLKEKNHQLNKHLIDFKKELEDLLEIRDLQLAQLQHLREVKENYQQIKYLELIKYPAAIQRAFLQEILQELYLDSEWGINNDYSQILWGFMIGDSINQSIDFAHGVVVYKTYDALYIYNQSDVPNFLNEKEMQELIIPENDWLDLGPNEKIGLFDKGTVKVPPQAQVLELGAGVKLPLVARHRKNGDRMQIKGMQGTKKVKDILIDEKIPRHLRDKQWIISDQTDNIIWLVSVREAEMNGERSETVPIRQLIYINQENK